MDQEIIGLSQRQVTALELGRQTVALRLETLEPARIQTLTL